MDGSHRHPNLKLALTTLKKEDPDLYKAKVRAARIKVPGEGPDYCGVNTIEARKTLLATYTQEVQQAAISKSKQLGNG